MTDEELIGTATALAGEFRPGRTCVAGEVAAAILTRAGNVYTGICIDASCSIGFCAEHAAVAEMLKRRESEIAVVVAVDDEGRILPPCGRCRELMWQVNPTNSQA
jgi:cytidine deaminase